MSQKRRTPDGEVTVTLGEKTARLKFNGCDPEYIANVCHARCCESSSAQTGTVISILPDEEKAMVARGACVKDGLLQPSPGARRCPFKDSRNLCGLHFTPDKPFGCIASPFTLSAGGARLIVRNRYKLLKCYDDGRKLPAYKAFKASLALLFGEAVADEIEAHFDAGGGDLPLKMARTTADKLLYLDGVKRDRTAGPGPG